jgi:aromatic ring-opening dioxygenase catalytic subunit (LigB family)
VSDLVGGILVPHTPYFTLTLADDPESPDARCFEEVRGRLEELRPDVIVAFDCDHLNTFFLDNLPTFAVAAVDRFEGPNDGSPGLERRVVPSHRGLGEALHAGGVEAGFDLALVQSLEVDHSIMVPLHFLTPDQVLPVVPVFINGLVPPLPTAARAHTLGTAVGRLVRAFPEDLRVAVMASGSINLEVGGPRVNEGELWGAPDPAWMEQVVERIRGGEVARLVEEATAERLASVGNVAGELLCLVALLGALGDARPDRLEPQPRFGHAYGTWVVEG